MRFLIAVLAVAGLVDSCLALRIHNQDPSLAPPCAVTASFDCGTVNHSRWAVFPPQGFDEPANSGKLHVPVALVGILGYALIAVLALGRRMWWTLQAAEVGFACAALLSFLEAYVIEKWCIYCLVSQAIITAILLCTIAALVKEHRKRRFDHSPAVAAL